MGDAAATPSARRNPPTRPAPLTPLSPAVIGSDGVFELTAAMVDVASESFDETAFADMIETELRSLEHLEVIRVGDNVVARTNLGRPQRLVLGGHTDTVPANDNFPGRIVAGGSNDGANADDELFGVGSADMKGGLAVMLTSARRHTNPAMDLTYVFYAREEVAALHSGLGELFDTIPEWLVGDVALLGEPTDGQIEAGCQGTMRVAVTLHGDRAHTARAWMGRNAIHRAAPLLAALAAYTPRQPEISGCRFHEALLAVGIEGGVSGNVVPDSVRITIGHRFAPDRTIAQAAEHVRAVVEPFLEAGDTVEVVDAASAAAPATDHPFVAHLVERNDLAVSAKLGWTDVARFAERGIPAANFGPGVALVAHTQGESVLRSSVERTWAALDDLIVTAVDRRGTTLLAKD
ncbi:MAG: succinyl-diaminopimelate desuccinylase [Actinobacteria bacterium]|nr:succinyl-diaminopimelate desuccinylase [Actinomycetota bacterium]